MRSRHSQSHRPERQEQQRQEQSRGGYGSEYGRSRGGYPEHEQEQYAQQRRAGGLQGQGERGGPYGGPSDYRRAHDEGFGAQEGWRDEGQGYGGRGTHASESYRGYPRGMEGGQYAGPYGGQESPEYGSRYGGAGGGRYDSPGYARGGPEQYGPPDYGRGGPEQYSGRGAQQESDYAGGGRGWTFGPDERREPAFDYEGGLRRGFGRGDFGPDSQWASDEQSRSTYGGRRSNTAQSGMWRGGEVEPGGAAGYRGGFGSARGGGYGVYAAGQTAGRYAGGQTGGGFRGADLARDRRGPKGYQRSDERIREFICERLAQHHNLDVGDVSVEVRNGVVTLEGTVPERRMKHEIEDMADSTWGVEDIENRLRVSSGRRGDNTQASRGQHAGGGQAGGARPPAQDLSSGQLASGGTTGGGSTGLSGTTGSTTQKVAGAPGSSDSYQSGVAGSVADATTPRPAGRSSGSQGSDAE